MLSVLENIFIFSLRMKLYLSKKFVREIDKKNLIL